MYSLLVFPFSQNFNQQTNHMHKWCNNTLLSSLFNQITSIWNQYSPNAWDMSLSTTIIEIKKQKLMKSVKRGREKTLILIHMINFLQ